MVRRLGTAASGDAADGDPTVGASAEETPARDRKPTATTPRRRRRIAAATMVAVLVIVGSHRRDERWTRSPADDDVHQRAHDSSSHDAIPRDPKPHKPEPYRHQPSNTDPYEPAGRLVARPTATADLREGDHDDLTFIRTRAISFSATTSSSWSATIRLSVAFSRSSSFSRLASLAFIPPYWLRHR